MKEAKKGHLKFLRWHKSPTKTGQTTYKLDLESNEYAKAPIHFVTGRNRSIQYIDSLRKKRIKFRLEFPVPTMIKRLEEGLQKKWPALKTPTVIRKKDATSLSFNVSGIQSRPAVRDVERGYKDIPKAWQNPYGFINFTLEFRIVHGDLSISIREMTIVGYSSRYILQKLFGVITFALMKNEFALADIFDQSNPHEYRISIKHLIAALLSTSQRSYSRNLEYIEGFFTEPVYGRLDCLHESEGESYFLLEDSESRSISDVLRSSLPLDIIENRETSELTEILKKVNLRCKPITELNHVLEHRVDGNKSLIENVSFACLTNDSQIFSRQLKDQFDVVKGSILFECFKLFVRVTEGKFDEASMQIFVVISNHINTQLGDLDKFPEYASVLSDFMADILSAYDPEMSSEVYQMCQQVSESPGRILRKLYENSISSDNIEERSRVIDQLLEIETRQSEKSKLFLLQADLFDDVDDMRSLELLQLAYDSQSIDTEVFTKLMSKLDKMHMYMQLIQLIHFHIENHSDAIPKGLRKELFEREAKIWLNKLSRPDVAASKLELALELAPEDFDLNVLYATVLERIGRKDEFLKQVDQISKLAKSTDRNLEQILDALAVENGVPNENDLKFWKSRVNLFLKHGNSEVALSRVLEECHEASVLEQVYDECLSDEHVLNESDLKWLIDHVEKSAPGSGLLVKLMVRCFEQGIYETQYIEAIFKCLLSSDFSERLDRYYLSIYPFIADFDGVRSLLTNFVGESAFLGGDVEALTFLSKLKPFDVEVISEEISHVLEDVIARRDLEVVKQIFELSVFNSWTAKTMKNIMRVLMNNLAVLDLSEMISPLSSYISRLEDADLIDDYVISVLNAYQGYKDQQDVVGEVLDIVLGIKNPSYVYSQVKIEDLVFETYPKFVVLFLSIQKFSSNSSVRRMNAFKRIVDFDFVNRVHHDMVSADLTDFLSTRFPDSLSEFNACLHMFKYLRDDEVLETWLNKVVGFTSDIDILSSSQDEVFKIWCSRYSKEALVSQIIKNYSNAKWGAFFKGKIESLVASDPVFERSLVHSLVHHGGRKVGVIMDDILKDAELCERMKFMLGGELANSNSTKQFTAIVERLFAISPLNHEILCHFLLSKVVEFPLDGGLPDALDMIKSSVGVKIYLKISQEFLSARNQSTKQRLKNWLRLLELFKVKQQYSLVEAFCWIGLTQDLPVDQFENEVDNIPDSNSLRTQLVKYLVYLNLQRSFKRFQLIENSESIIFEQAELHREVLSGKIDLARDVNDLRRRYHGFASAKDSVVKIESVRPSMSEAEMARKSLPINQYHSWERIWSLSAPGESVVASYVQHESSSLDHHIGVQALCMKHNLMHLLRKYRYRVWEDLTLAPYKFLSSQRYPSRSVPRLVTNEITLSIMDLNGFLVASFPEKINLDFLVETLDKSLDQIANERIGYAELGKAYKHPSIDRLLGEVLGKKYNVYSLKGLNQKIFFSVQDKSFYCDLDYYISRPASHLVHRILTEYWAVRLRVSQFLKLHPNLEILRVFDDFAKIIGSIGSGDEVRGARAELVKEMVRRKGQESCERLAYSLKTLNVDEVILIQQSLTLHIHNLILSQTLDLIGVTESILDIDLMKENPGINIMTKNPLVSSLFEFIRDMNLREVSVAGNVA